jgi:formylglycine-generating enzyme required for sulfatase activity
MPVDPPARARRWLRHDGGIVRIGHAGTGFAFDCEGPAHDVLLRPYQLASTLVTNAEWQAFIADGGYADPRLWLSDGWAWVQREGVRGPLRWQEGGKQMTLAGPQTIAPQAPVTHIGFYEADAFAAWAGARLPTEAEWEHAARDEDASAGTQLDAAVPAQPDGTSPGLAMDGVQFPALSRLPGSGGRGWRI